MLIGPPIPEMQLFKQDRRWNADKPSAALDPYIPTWLTTLPANHIPANFWKSFFFLTLEGNYEKWCNLRLIWWGSISNLKLPFSDSWSKNNHLDYLSPIIYQSNYYGNVDIFSHYFTQDEATWFSMLPIYIENLYRFLRGLIYIYIFICNYISSSCIIFSRSLPRYIVMLLQYHRNLPGGR